MGFPAAGKPRRWADEEMNTGKSFEQLVQHLFQELLSQQIVQNVNVRHNVILPGKLLNHQIDVYWEFVIAGIVYRTIIQAKDWTSSVPQGELLKFKGVLDDLPGQPRGIFVTTTGYQDGAREYAAQNGILLYELQKRQRASAMHSKELRINISAYIPIAHCLKFKYDKDWTLQEKRRRGIPDNDKVNAHVATDRAGHLLLFDEVGKLLGTTKDVADGLFRRDFRVMDPIEYDHIFQSPTFAKTDLSGFPWAKLESILFRLEVRRKTQEFVFSPDDFIEFILLNISDQTRHLFDAKKRLIR